METFRCPTCVSVLVDPTVRRCPACHTKLRKRRAKPIILGESSRIDTKLTPFDLATRTRMESSRAPMPAAVTREAAAPAPAPIARPPVIEREPVIEIPDIEIVAELAPLPGLDADPIQVITPQPEPDPLAEERAPSPLDGTLNEMLDELFRKARADSDE